MNSADAEIVQESKTNKRMTLKTFRLPHLKEEKATIQKNNKKSLTTLFDFVMLTANIIRLNTDE